MIDNRRRIVVDENSYLVIDGVKIARYLPDTRALEFIEPRSGHRRDGGRRRVVIKLVELAGIRG